MKPILPGNQLCMRCHTRAAFPMRPPILPEAHSFHGVESTGNQCINCHMPQTVYMQRHPRHDHGFTIPDPWLTKQHGIPNACNKCHTDKDDGLGARCHEKWWGPKMDEPQDPHPRHFIAKARKGDHSARDGLLALLDSDEIPHWKASASLLLERWIGEPGVIAAVTAQLQHTHPLVRAKPPPACLEIHGSQGQHPISQRSRALLDDPVRSVRVTAAWALRDSPRISDSLLARTCCTCSCSSMPTSPAARCSSASSGLPVQESSPPPSSTWRPPSVGPELAALPSRPRHAQHRREHRADHSQRHRPDEAGDCKRCAMPSASAPKQSRVSITKLGLALPAARSLAG
jgi:hypothetical protein